MNSIEFRCVCLFVCVQSHDWDRMCLWAGLMAILRLEMCLDLGRGR